uniref:Uncharacterized protein n=1 Tax=Arundo donax TaxID=35708 RepID=A0A0A9E7S5_ARUDO
MASANSYYGHFSTICFLFAMTKANCSTAPFFKPMCEPTKSSLTKLWRQSIRMMTVCGFMIITLCLFQPF